MLERTWHKPPIIKRRAGALANLPNRARWFPQQGCGRFDPHERLIGNEAVDFHAPVLLGQPMEDFLSKQPFAGLAADLIEDQLATKAEIAGSEIWQEAAEDCVLARIKSLRLIGGLPRHKSPLPPDERIERLKALLHLWAKGCTCAVDEDLFADILNRHRQKPAYSS